MRFLIVSEDFSWTTGAYRIQEFEHQDVRAYSMKAEGKEHLGGIIKQVSSIREGLNWVGRNGYVFCDGEEDGTRYRKMGHSTYAANKFLERMENDRLFQMMIVKRAGMAIPNYHGMRSIEEGIKFVKDNPDTYVLKQTGHTPKEWNYVGSDEDGTDIIHQLEWIKRHPKFQKMGEVPFILQELCEGIEFAVGAWWQYNDWYRDADGKILIELNREHKKMLDGDRGITCGEMGTVMLFTTEKTKLFSETLEKLTPILRERCSDVCLDIDANCIIVEENGGHKAYLLEITPREGYPASSLQQYLLNTPVSEFYAGLIDGDRGEFEFKKDWGVVTNLGCGTYPHDFDDDPNPNSFLNQPVKFEPSQHLLPTDLKWDGKMWRVADDYGWVATATFHGSIADANKKCVEAMKTVEVRAPVFRTDIGQVFVEKELPKLETWGYA